MVEFSQIMRYNDIQEKNVFFCNLLFSSGVLYTERQERGENDEKVIGSDDCGSACDIRLLQ